MVTIGAQHAIALIARTIMARGDRALVENPSYPHAFDALKAAGGRLVPVSVTTDEGWDELGLEQAIQRTSPSLGYLMPDFHNPTGRSMSPELRERVLSLANRHGTTLIADETMAELGFDDPKPVAPFSNGGNSILVGSVGKSIWGGVRIGWIRADRTIIQRLVRERSAGDLGSPVLEQLVVLNLLEDYDGILASRRAYLRAGRDYLEAGLKERFPEWDVPHVPGGLTAWVGLGVPISSQLTLAARNEGLLIAAGPRFGIEGAFERFLRVPFSYSPEETDRAIDALHAAWNSVGKHPLPDSQFLAEVV
jgi:DNA-binding transcriptional MocR family regulator